MTKHLTLLVISTLSAIGLYAGVGMRRANAAPGDIDNLGTLGGTFSFGSALNAFGQVVGYSYLTGNSGPHRAFLYTGTPGVDGQMSDLGTLGGTNSYGYAINAGGQVAGTSDMTGDSALHAFLYTGTPGSGGAMADLGTLGGTYSAGIALNASGQVAGYSSLPGSTETHASLYTGTPGVDGLMIDLDAWLDVNNPTEGAKWTLNSAFGLTDNGLITGTGFYDDGPGGLSDGERAFLLDASALVPEPGGLALICLGLPALLRRARRFNEKPMKGEKSGR